MKYRRLIMWAGALLLWLLFGAVVFSVTPSSADEPLRPNLRVVATETLYTPSPDGTHTYTLTVVENRYGHRFLVTCARDNCTTVVFEARAR